MVLRTGVTVAPRRASPALAPGNTPLSPEPKGLGRAGLCQISLHRLSVGRSAAWLVPGVARRLQQRKGGLFGRGRECAAESRSGQRCCRGWWADGGGTRALRLLS
jgi:hypothetical protein